MSVHWGLKKHLPAKTLFNTMNTKPASFLVASGKLRVCELESCFFRNSTNNMEDVLQQNVQQINVQTSRERPRQERPDIWWPKPLVSGQKSMLIALVFSGLVVSSSPFSMVKTSWCPVDFPNKTNPMIFTC